MDIKIEDKDGVKVYYVEGEINMSTAPQLKKDFEKFINVKTRKFIINFTSVAYIDSSGLATLVEIFKKLRGYSGALKLTNLSPKIKSLFEITKLERLFDILEDEEEAIKSFV